MTTPSDDHSNIFVGPKIAYVPSEDFPPHRALEYIIIHHPQFLEQAINNPYIMAAGETSLIRALYRQHNIQDALDHMDGSHRSIMTRIFRCPENDKTAALRQDKFYS